MRRTGSVAVIAALAATVACGAGSAGHRTVSDVQVLQAAYGKAVHAKTMKVALDETLHAAGQDAHVSGSGAADLADHALRLNLSVPQLGAMDLRVLGHALYVQLPAALRQVTHGAPWMSLDLDALTKHGAGAGLGQLQDMSGQDPSQLLGVLQGVSDDVRTVGTATVRGEHTTHYRATVDVRKAVARVTDPAARQAVQRMYDRLGVRTLPVDVWVGDDGLVRRIHLAMAHAAGGSGGSVDLTMDMYDYGTPVHVTRPPAGQTFDVTSALEHARIAG